MDRGCAGICWLCWAVEQCWLGRAAFLTGHCTPSALVLLAVSTLPHSPFVSLSPGCQDTHKFTYLKSIYVLCKTALKRGLTQGLDLFCQTCEVVENITVRGHLVSGGWAQAPLALAPCVDSAWVGQVLGALGAARSHPGCARQDLLEKEPRDRMTSRIRYLAMITINELRCAPRPRARKPPA